MRGIYNTLHAIIGVTIMSIVAMPTAYASFSDDQEFKANGAIVSSLQAKIPDFMVANMLNNFNFSFYQTGPVFGIHGPEMVSSNPDLDMVNKHMRGYCSPNIPAEKAGFGCTGLQGVPAEEARLVEMGDVSTGALLSPAKYSPGVAIASQMLIRNIVSPAPDPKYRDYVTSGAMNDDATKKADYAKFMAGQAVLGVAIYSFNEMYAARADGTALGITDNNNPAASKTLMEIMKDESTRRFEQPDFADYINRSGVQALTTQELLQEMAIMQAYTMWMDYQRYKQMERIEALLAASLAKFVNDSYVTGALIAKGSNPAAPPSP